MAAGAAEGVSVWSLSPEDLSEVTSEKFEPQINPEGKSGAQPVKRLLIVKGLNGAFVRLLGRERVSVRTLEEGRSEIHELGDDRAHL